jgi:hypothetical protein
MVRAFSTLLMRDAQGQHWLVTPHERLAIAVEDAAFIAIDMEVRPDPASGQGGTVLAFRLNTDDIVLCGPEPAARGRYTRPARVLPRRAPRDGGPAQPQHLCPVDRTCAGAGPDADPAHLRSKAGARASRSCLH